MIWCNQWTKYLSLGFSEGDFIRFEKVKLKENYTKWNYFFYSEDHTCRLLIPKIVKIKIL